jgi:DNA-binding YbaB/EbfC family protein
MAKYKHPSKGPSVGGGGAKKDMNHLIKQAQKMQEEASKAQDEVAAMEFSVSAGGGAVKIVIGGDKQIRSLEISPDIVDPEDVEMLSDILVAGINEAIRTAEEELSNKMSTLTGGLSIPGL